MCDKLLLQAVKECNIESKKKKKKKKRIAIEIVALVCTSQRASYLNRLKASYTTSACD